MKKILFKNRDDAFKQLCKALPLKEMSLEPWLIIATSAGAVPIAYKLAEKLNVDFDFMFTEKINAKKNNECEIAIITETEEIIIHEELMRSFNIKLDDIYIEAKEKYNIKLKEYIANYRDGKKIINMKGKNILLVDEGLNTGLTMMACIKSAISHHGKSVAVAVPILPKVTIHDIESIADDLYYVKAPDHFIAIDFYYETLEPIKLDNIKNIINKE